MASERRTRAKAVDRVARYESLNPERRLPRWVTYVGLGVLAVAAVAVATWALITT